MKEIIDIALFLFDDEEFTQIQNFVYNKNYSGLVELIEEEKELTEILLSFEDDSIELSYKLIMLKEIEDLIINSYLGEEVTQQKING